MKAKLSRFAALLVSTAAIAPGLAAGQEVEKSDEIVVTAQKREQRILDVPISLSAFPGTQLEFTGADSLDDAVALTPGVSVFENRPGSNLIQIRGVSSIVGDATIGYYLDDLPFTIVGQNFQPDINPYDLERIEILRGPQGTLYGAGSEGGTVRILTANADPGGFDAKVRVTGSSVADGENGYGVDGVVNMALVPDRFAVRLSVSHADDAGYVDNSLLRKEDVNSLERNSYRAKATFRPNEQWEFRASYWRNEAESGGENQSTASFDRPVAVEENNRSVYDLYNFAFERSGPSFDIYSATSYIDYENDVQDASLFGVGAGNRVDIPFQSTSVSQEFRLSNTDGSFFDWQLGLFYLKSKTQTGLLVQTQIPGGLFTSEFSRDEAISTQYAIFGEAYLNFSNNVTATLGARYYEDERSREDFLPSSVAGLAFFGLPARRETQFDGWSPRLNLRYEFAPDQSVYVNVARGVRSGLLQASTSVAALSVGAPTSVDGESVWSYEVGSKLSLLNGDLVAEVAAYRSDWSDIQFTVSTLVDLGLGPQVINFVNNAGDAGGYGLEGAIAYAPTKNLTLGLNGSWNDMEYDGAIPSVTTGSERVQLVPELTLSGSLEYRRPIGGDGLEAFFYSNASHTSARTDYAFGISTKGDPITTVNARAGVNNDHWTLALYGENLADENGAIVNSLLIPLQFRPQPRTFGVQLSWRY